MLRIAWICTMTALAAAQGKECVLVGRLANRGLIAEVTLLAPEGALARTTTAATGEWTLHAPPRPGLRLRFTAPKHLTRFLDLGGDPWIGTSDLGEMILDPWSALPEDVIPDWTVTAGKGASLRLFELAENGRLDARHELGQAKADGEGKIRVPAGAPTAVAIISAPDRPDWAFLVDAGGRPLRGAVLPEAPVTPPVVIEETDAPFTALVEVEWPILRPGSGRMVTTLVRLTTNELVRREGHWEWRLPPYAACRWQLRRGTTVAEFRTVPGTIIRQVPWRPQSAGMIVAVDALTKQEIPAVVAIDGGPPAARDFMTDAGGRELLVIGEPDHDLAVARGAFPPPPATRRDVELAPRPTLSGQVIGETAPVRGLSVWYRRQAGAPHLRLGDVREDGTYGPFFVPGGAGEAWLVAADGRHADARPITGSPAEKLFADFALRRAAALSGIARRGGQGVLGARIHLIPGPLSPESSAALTVTSWWRSEAALRLLASPAVRHTTSDSSGHYDLGNLVAGTYALLVDVEGLTPYLEPELPLSAPTELMIECDRLGVTTPVAIPTGADETITLDAFPFGGRRILRGTGEAATVSIPFASGLWGTRPGSNEPLPLLADAPPPPPRAVPMRLRLRRPSQLTEPVLACILPVQALAGGPVLSAILVGVDPVTVTVPAGPFVLRCFGADLPWTTYGAFETPVTGGDLLIPLEAPRRATGRAWALDGHLGGGIPVWIWPDRDAVIRGVRFPPLSGTTTDDGMLLWPEIPAGRARAWVGRPGESLEIDLSGGNSEDLADLALVRSTGPPVEARGADWRDRAGRRIERDWLPWFAAAHEPVEQRAAVAVAPGRDATPLIAHWVGAIADPLPGRPFVIETPRGDRNGWQLRLVPLAGHDFDPGRPVLDVPSPFSGRIEIPHLPSGGWAVQYESGACALRIDLQVEDEGPRHALLPTETGSVALKLWDENGSRTLALAQVEVHLAEWLAPEFFGTGRRASRLVRGVSDDAGRILLQNLPLGRRLHVRVRSADGRSALRTDIDGGDRLNNPPDQELRVPIVGDIDCRVEADNLPVAGAAVTVYSPDGRLAGEPVLTDTEGRCRISSIGGGRLTLVAEAEGYVARAQVLEYGGGLTLGDQTLTLQRGRGATVIARDENRRPMPEVSAERPARPLPASLALCPTASFAAGAEWLSDSQGTLVLPPIGKPARFVLRCTRYRPVALMVEPGGTESVTFREPR